MELFGTSRNTVLADIRDIKDEIDLFGLELTSVTNRGYELVGEERSVRELLWIDLQSLQNNECLAAVRGYLQAMLVEKTNEDIDFHELCRCLIKQYETDLDTHLFIEENGLESIMIQASWIRSLDGNWIKMAREEQAALMGTLSYRSVQRSAMKLKQSGIVLPSEELLYITSLLLGIKTANFAGQRDEDADVSRLSERLAVNFERVSCLNYVNRALVCEQMSNHIRPMYYRLKYGLQANNPLSSDIQKTYPMTFEFTKRAASETGLSELSDDELAYLTIYLTAGLDREMLEEGDTSSEKVLVVGAESNTTITLLRKQIADACGLALDYSSISASKLKRWELDRYALVISLVPISENMRSENLVEVSAFLSDADFKNIFRVLRSNRIISRYSSMIEEIEAIFKRNIPGCDDEALASDRLYFELFRYLNKYDSGIGKKLPAAGLCSRFEFDCVPMRDDLSWEQAIMDGCTEICRRSGSSLLLERMANLVKSPKLQWYRMAEGIVLVHCPMQGDPHGRVTAQAVVSNTNGVCFSDGKTVGAVICLATIDRYSHWSALYTIYSLYDSLDKVRASGIAGSKNGRDCHDE